jgi:uncharacterized protein
LFWFAFALDEASPTRLLNMGWSWRWWPLYGFYQQDHFPGMPGTLRERLAVLLAQHQVVLPPKAIIRVVTQCRFLGYGFNPVSFWFCADATGSPLAVVVEVQNTFLEVKPYVITQPNAAGWWQATVPKHFYVSPFLAVEDWFDFRIRWLNDDLTIAIHTLDGNTRQTKLVSTFTGKAMPLTGKTLATATLRYPFVPLATIGLIHWHALQLWIKRIPFSPKHVLINRQTDRLRPWNK